MISGAPATGRRIALVGCVKSKRRGTHPARDLYTSALFTKRRAFVEARGLPWFVLSALHGLVAPDDRIAHYDKTLNRMSVRDRAAWGQMVVRQLEERLGPVAGTTFEVHAGARYVEAIEPLLRTAGAVIHVPTAGKRMGEQLRWYARGGA